MILKSKNPKLKLGILCLFVVALLSVHCRADGSKILATGGVTQVEGAAGGGLVPWAVIAGYAQEGETGFTLAKSKLNTDDFVFDVSGFAMGVNNRFEFSYAKQRLELGPLQAALSLPVNELKQEVFGVKAKLFGDLIYDASPQFSFGAQYKKLDDFTIPEIAGAAESDGIDYYLSASKFWLEGLSGYPLLMNLTLRSSNANQLGLMGFGGDLNNSRELLWEFNSSVFITRNWVVGYEFRQKPNNLSFAKEDHWQDIYLAWFYDQSIASVLSYVDLGSVAGLEEQQGLYLSLQASF